MNVAAILKDKELGTITTRAQANLRDVAQTMQSKRIGAVMVVGESDNLIGIISERDIVGACAQSGADALQKSVGETMTKDVHTCVRADTIDRLMEIMTRQRFRHLPVVEDGKILGIVSIGDVVKQRIAEVEMEASEMRKYIATG
jgi:signal-transduction protein with cAMP-binding, CBS, and nucleotidyltransferase domain